MRWMQRTSQRLKNWLASTGTAQEFARDGWGWKRAWERQRVGVNGLDAFPSANCARLFRWSRESDLAYACVQKIVEAAQDPDLIVQRRKNARSPWEPEAGHPLRQLLMRPNPQMSEAEFLGAWLASEEICGEFFCEIERNERGAPVALWPLDPACLSPLVEGGWRWKDGGDEITLAEKDVFHTLRRDPQHPWLPLAPLRVALGSVEADAMQSAFVRAFFKNSGIPSGIVKIKGVLTGDAGKKRAEQIQTNWIRRYGFGGTAQQGPAVLDDNAEYERVGANLEEIEGSTLRAQSEARICGVFGVPPLLVSAYVGLLYVNQRASAIEAQREFWANKMSPTFKRMRAILTWTLLLEFEAEKAVRAELVRLNWDMAQVVALQESMAERSMRAREDFRVGALTLNEYREVTGRAPLPDGDYYLRRANQVPVTADVVTAQLQAAVQVTEQSVAVALTGARNLEEPQENDSKRGRKSYDWDGYEVAREPTPHERKADVRATGKAMDAGRDALAAQLLIARSALIQEAVKTLAGLEAGQLHELTLHFPLTAGMVLREEITLLFARGQLLLADELRRLGMKKTPPRKSAEPTAQLEQLAQVTISRVLNDLQARAAAIAAHLLPLVSDREAWLAAVEAQLRGASTAFLTRAAAEAAHVAINLGRRAEATAHAEIIGWVYSSVLDAQTCQTCHLADGLTEVDEAKLPPVPNPDCGNGYGACRCVHVPTLEE